MTTRTDAVALDAGSPLAAFRERFSIPDEGLVYLNANSLGRLPLATAERLRRVVDHEWGGSLVGSWSTWLDDFTRVGDRLGSAFLGARPGAGRTHRLGDLAWARSRHDAPPAGVKTRLECPAESGALAAVSRAQADTEGDHKPAIRDGHSAKERA